MCIFIEYFENYRKNVAVCQIYWYPPPKKYQISAPMIFNECVFFSLTHIRRQTWNALGNTCVRFFLVCWHVLLSIVSWGGSKIRCSHEILQFLRAFNGQNRKDEMKKKSVSQNTSYSFISFHLFLSFVWMQKWERETKKMNNTFWNTSFKLRSQTKRKW